jgi:hypothetical protein
MRGAIPPLPQYVFMAWCLVKHRDNFTFIFIKIISYSAYYNSLQLITSLTVQGLMLRNCERISGFSTEFWKWSVHFTQVTASKRLARTFWCYHFKIWILFQCIKMWNTLGSRGEVIALKQGKTCYRNCTPTGVSAPNQYNSLNSRKSKRLLSNATVFYVSLLFWWLTGSWKRYVSISV